MWNNYYQFSYIHGEVRYVKMTLRTPASWSMQANLTWSGSEWLQPVKSLLVHTSVSAGGCGSDISCTCRCCICQWWEILLHSYWPLAHNNKPLVSLKLTSLLLRPMILNFSFSANFPPYHKRLQIFDTLTLFVHSSPNINHIPYSGRFTMWGMFHK